MDVGFYYDFAWALHYSRADRHVVTFLDGREQLRNLAQRSRPVGVHKQDEAAPRIEYPHADSRALAHVRAGENTDANVAFLEETSKREGLISAAVVRYDELELELLGRTPVEGLEHRSGQARLLVIRRNDDRQPYLTAGRGPQVDRRAELT